MLTKIEVSAANGFHLQMKNRCNKVDLKSQFAAFDSLVVCNFFRQTEAP